MRQEFYSHLGDQLYNMKNSPFIKIGDQAPLRNDSKKFTNDSALSFDPDRLFNPDKRKEREEFLDSEII